MKRKKIKKIKEKYKPNKKRKRAKVKNMEGVHVLRMAQHRAGMSSRASTVGPRGREPIRGPEPDP